MSQRGIQALIRIHRWQLDELRRRAAPLEQERAQLLDRGREILEQLDRERQAVMTGAGTSADMQAFQSRVMVEHNSITRKVLEIEQAIDALRDQMADAFQDVKKFEITEEQRLDALRREQLQREQSQLDEIGLNNHRRRDMGDSRLP